MPQDPMPPSPSRLLSQAQREAATASDITGGLENNAQARDPTSKLRLELRDLRHPMTKAFLEHIDPTKDVDALVKRIVQLLYSTNQHIDQPMIINSQLHVPPTRSVTLVLREMEGVAYTTGLDLDDDHKEIHLSLSYISHVVSSNQKSIQDRSPSSSTPAPPATSSAIPFRQPQTTPVPKVMVAPTRNPVREELLGVICHELVHCYQHNARGTAPGGLIEGIADWVRLHAGYVPPHWKREAGKDWDAGYQTTGYFLDWLETKHGAGTIAQLNEALRGPKYHEHEFWEKLYGKDVKHLWKEYCKSLVSI